MKAETAPIGPNLRPHYVLAGVLLCLGLVMGWLAFDLARLLGRNAVPRDYGFLAVMIGITLLILAAAYRFFTRPFGVRAAIRFDAEAIVFERWGIWGGHKVFALPRREIAAFWIVNAPYTKIFSVEVSPAHAIALGLRQPTTRQDRAVLPAPKLSFPGHGFDLPPEAVLDRLRQDLAKSGLTLGTANEGRSVKLGTRWPVVAL